MRAVLLGVPLKPTRVEEHPPYRRVRRPELEWWVKDLDVLERRPHKDRLLSLSSLGPVRIDPGGVGVGVRQRGRGGAVRARWLRRIARIPRLGVGGSRGGHRGGRGVNVGVWPRGELGEGLEDGGGRGSVGVAVPRHVHRSLGLGEHRGGPLHRASQHRRRGWPTPAGLAVGSLLLRRQVGGGRPGERRQGVVLRIGVRRRQGGLCARIQLVRLGAVVRVACEEGDFGWEARIELRGGHLDHVRRERRSVGLWRELWSGGDEGGPFCPGCPHLGWRRGNGIAVGTAGHRLACGHPPRGWRLSQSGTAIFVSAHTRRKHACLWRAFPLAGQKQVGTVSLFQLFQLGDCNFW
eukprot:m.39106 g.39106  ORF g.39106 m.39106 type:complete len:350 (+) comp7912_c0_seq1:1869-2918(+)